MALSGVEIFKHLPKTNCKKCGHPTCLAFAMKLAAKQATLDACPDASEEAKAFLGAASEPPIRGITIGAGEKALKVGEETVLFRHEKKFVNPCGFALAIKDTDADIEARAKSVADSEIERVGQKLRVELIAVENASGDPAKFASAVAKATAAAPNAGIILATENPAAVEAALTHVSGKKPLICGANADNVEAMVNLAKYAGCSLVVRADGIDAVSQLTEKVVGMGFKDIVIDSGARKPKDMIEQYTQIRRAALKKGVKALGFPIISFAENENPYVEQAIASVAVAKYASIVVLSDISLWKTLGLIALRQNLYTDPQVPMQVGQNVYKVGDAKEDAPLLITTNFSLTYFIVLGEVENSKVPSWLAVMETEGLSVLTAWAAGKFTAAKIAQYIQESGIEGRISHKELIIPGYVAVLSGALEDKLPGWKITVGPREANALPAFLKNKTVAA
ncbi:MAG: acetyl-CoA decarbonylase/synthase complex subunit gamma [Nitrospirota bacterium]